MPSNSDIKQTISNGVLEINTDLGLDDGPVYIFLAENYDYWCNELGVDRTEWDWCHWGEK